MAGLKRTHGCGAIDLKDVGQTVVLGGWVQRRRDHGGLVFIDLRDRSGIVQVVFSPDVAAAGFATAEAVRPEYVLLISGRVRRRPEGTANPHLGTGEVEVYAQEARILNKAKTPPFYIEDGIEVDETLRLRYRYLDLRRPEMQKALMLRHRATQSVRNFLDGEGFLEIETPMLTRSTPEGARDFLVPSRLNPGQFYALPQSPQLFKQILMVAGLERYFQVVRCFRDEDLRADRQPEFTQIDMELSFVEEDDVMAITEAMIARLIQDTLGVDVATPFPRLTYAEAMAKYGTDKPDIRFGLKLVDFSDLAATCGFKVFRTVVEGGGQVKGIRVPGAASLTRKELDELTAFAQQHKARGLAYLLYESDGIKSPIAKFFSPNELSALAVRCGAQPGDAVFFVADRAETVAFALAALRQHFAQRLGLIQGRQLAFVWVVEFPLLEYDDKEQRWVAVHHPFTAPREEDLALLESEPERVRARAYDLVLNGVEAGGGSIRIHRRDIQELIFKAIGMKPEDAREKFGFLLEAFEYGTPPHGGIAFGLDRLVMLLAQRDTIRDVMAFPKTQSAADMMTGAPGKVSPGQLRELAIKSVEIVDQPGGAIGKG